MAQHLTRNSDRWGQMKPAHRRKVVARLVAKGHQNRIPDRFAPPEIRHKRAHRAHLRTPVAPGSAMTFGQVKQEARQQAKLAYMPQIRDIGQQIEASNRLSGQIPDYYRAYQQAIAQAEQQTAAANQAAAGQIQGFQGADSGFSTGQNAQTQAGLAKTSKLTGGTVDPQLARDAQNAAAVRGRMLASSGATLATQGAAQGAYLADQGRIGAGRQLHDLLAQAKVTQGLRSKREAVKREKGAFRAKTRGDLISNAQQEGLAALGLNLNMAKAAAQQHQEAQKIRISRKNQRSEARDRAQRRQETHRQNAQQNKLARQRNQISQENADTNRYRAMHPSKSHGSSKYLPQSSQNVAHGKIDEAVAWFKKAQASMSNPDPKKRVTGAQMRQELLTGAGPIPTVDQLYVDAAQSIVYNGGLEPGNVRALTHAGVKVGTYHLINPAKQQAAQNVAGTGGTAVGLLLGKLLGGG